MGAKMRRWSAVLALSMFLPSCEYDDGDDSGRSNGAGDDIFLALLLIYAAGGAQAGVLETGEVTVEDLDVGNAYVGDGGSVGLGSEVAATTSGVLRREDWAGLALTAVGHDETSRTALIFRGGPEDRAFAPGTLTVLDDIRGSGDSGLYVHGAFGPRPGDWSFDAPAERVVLEVDEAPTDADRVFRFEATFEDGRSTWGSFQIRGDPNAS